MNKKLSWTKTPPKEEGYYWRSVKGEASIVYVHVAGQPSDKNVEWYGPLPVPAGP